MIIGMIKAHPTENRMQGKPVPDDRWCSHRGDLITGPGTVKGPPQGERAFMSAQPPLTAPGVEVAAAPAGERQRRRRG
jgi:hypothetical protein